MELSKKTTILFTPALHRHLVQEARRRGASLGQLVRDACERQYGFCTVAERVRAVEELSGLALPVASPEEMKRQSVPAPEELMP
jgi:hypothetical protein